VSIVGDGTVMMVASTRKLLREFGEKKEAPPTGEASSHERLLALCAHEELTPIDKDRRDNTSSNM
jgi:hypothetical protein